MALNDRCYAESDPRPGSRTAREVMRQRSGLDPSTAPMRDGDLCSEVQMGDFQE